MVRGSFVLTALSLGLTSLSASEPQALSWIEELRPLLDPEEAELADRLEPSWRREAFAKELLEALDPYPETAVHEPLELWKARLPAVNNDFPAPGLARTLALLLGNPTSRHVVSCPSGGPTIEIWNHSLGGSKALKLFWRGEKSSSRLAGWILGEAGSSPGVAPPGCAHPPEPEPSGRELRKLLSELGSLADLPQQIGISHRRLLGNPTPEVAPPAEVTVLARLPDGSIQVRLELGLPSPQPSPTPGFWIDGELLAEGQEGVFDRFSLWVRPEPKARADLPTSVSLERIWPRLPDRLVLSWSATPSGPRWERTVPLGGSQIKTAMSHAVIAPAVELLVPVGRLVRGRIRVEAEVSGVGVAKVEFGVDDKPILTRSRPPFEVDLELAQELRPQKIHARALSAAGKELDRAEAWVNAGSRRIDFRFQGAIQEGPEGSWRYRFLTQVQVPPDRKVEGVDFYAGAEQVANLNRPPFRLELAGWSSKVAYLRSVLRLEGEPPLERVVPIGLSGFGESVDVDFVEFYVSATDRKGEPVSDLSPEDLEVREEKRPQEIRRLERMTNVPALFALLFDTSASMAEELPVVEQAAFGFFARVLRPTDRAIVLAFGDEVTLASPVTSRLEVLAGALASLRARGATRLFDALAEGIHQTAGARGARAVLLFTDGVDAGSELRLSQVLQYALRIGTPIYVLGLGVPVQPPDARAGLEQLAQATGGRCFFFERVREAERVYRQIELDLRSQWLVAYQSSIEAATTTFRTLELRARRPGIRLRGPRGYYP